MAIIVAAPGVINTKMISVRERRRELALLRAAGATRSQVRQIVVGENALMGLLGGLFGVIAGMGAVAIVVTTFGGRSWGVGDLDLWPAVGRALLPTLLNGVVGLLFTPAISALAAWLPLRGLLRGTPVRLLNTRREAATGVCGPARRLATILRSAGAVL